MKGDEIPNPRNSQGLSLACSETKTGGHLPCGKRVILSFLYPPRVIFPIPSYKCIPYDPAIIIFAYLRPRCGFAGQLEWRVTTRDLTNFIP